MHKAWPWLELEMAYTETCMYALQNILPLSHSREVIMHKLPFLYISVLITNIQQRKRKSNNNSYKLSGNRNGKENCLTVQWQEHSAEVSGEVIMHKQHSDLFMCKLLYWYVMKSEMHVCKQFATSLRLPFWFGPDEGVHEYWSYCATNEAGLE